MPAILLVHGPNLNMLGKRDPAHYGSATLAEIEALAAAEAEKRGFALRSFQSNHEGALIDWLQSEAASAAGVVINAGALTHTSYSLHDALLDTKLPAVEVHLSDTAAREEWRRASVIAPACVGTISGKKEQGYVEAVELLASKLAVGSVGG